ncbi:bifunctional riboflavin kinase/FAD synthetase [Betaproteobacteria bacterium SCN2]|jgi:riboflavin kinase/FMN adenylyltransferase|nr:bifunctional riboflavin kinase/FAD synthetase [Betaproteobacteria bacterium SCN2]
MRITHGLQAGNSPASAPHAVTIGNFDGLHRGHQAMLARLKEEAAKRGLPSCVLTFEPHPREFFAPAQAPARLSSLREKSELIRGAGIDRLHVCRFNQRFASLSPDDFIQQVLINSLGTRWLLVGDDFRFGAQRAGDFALLKEAGDRLGFEVESLPTVSVEGKRASSTAVREALAAGDMQHATELLGRPYSISGHVMHGNKLGRQIGFPTANIQLQHNRPPLSGIFAVEVYGLNGAPLQGVASLGTRPTVHENGKPTLEVFIFDFRDDLYGRRLRVDFLRKLRDEEKYPDLDALIAQINRDVDNARAFFASR